MLRKEFGDGLDEDGLRYIQQAINGAKRMRALIDSLLSFAQIDCEAGKAEKFCAAAALKTTFLNLECQIDESNALITADNLPVVHVMRSRFNQLLQNLIGNSLKYRGAASPKIHVGFRVTESEQIFFVSDNGIGIASEHRERVFGIFKRLHTRDEYAGTGIGLAICQRIAESWNGRIWIEDQPGPGCKVCFSIPVKRQTNVAYDEVKLHAAEKMSLVRGGRVPYLSKRWQGFANKA
jgi:chemotaxis family two-component system sensor kinase Cph1